MDDNDASGRSSGDINSKTALPLYDKEGKYWINDTIITSLIKI